MKKGYIRRTYTVAWDVEVDATDMADAVKQALEIQRTSRTATLFWVKKGCADSSSERAGWKLVDAVPIK